MTTISYNALGTRWNIDISDEVTSVSTLKRAVKKLLTDFESNYSRFLSTSIVSKLNREGFIDDPSDELVSLLLTGVNLYNETNGVFNFLVGNILVQRGYGTTAKYLKQSENAPTPNPLVDLVITKQKVTLTGAGSIDLGGFGKGYLIDKIARYFREELQYSQFVINGGGDLYVENDEVVELVLEHPKDSSLQIGKVAIHNLALCTSSPFKRRWKEKATNKIVSHIVTNSIDSTYASYVVAHSATIADAYATTLSALNGEYHKLNPTILNTISFLVTDTKNSVNSPNFPLVTGALERSAVVHGTLKE